MLGIRCEVLSIRYQGGGLGTSLEEHFGFLELLLQRRALLLFGGGVRLLG